MDLDCYSKRIVLDMIWHAVMIQVGLVLKDLSRYCKRMVLDLVWQRYDMVSDFIRRGRKGEKQFWIYGVVYFRSTEERQLWSLDTGRKRNRIGLRRLLVRDQDVRIPRFYITHGDTLALAMSSTAVTSLTVISPHPSSRVVMLST